MNDYWRTSGDAEWQIKVNDWATQRYGADWHDKYTAWEIEALYEKTHNRRSSHSYYWEDVTCKKCLER